MTAGPGDLLPGAALFGGEAVAWGAANEGPHAELEDRALEYAATVAQKSPPGHPRKLAFNAADDGIAGMQAFASEATRLAYMTEEAREGRDAFLEQRAPPTESPFPYYA